MRRAPLRPEDFSPSAAELRAQERLGAQDEKAGMGSAIGTGIGTLAGLAPLLGGPEMAPLVKYTLPAGMAVGGSLGGAVGGELGARETKQASSYLQRKNAMRQKRLTEAELREAAYERLRATR